MRLLLYSILVLFAGSGHSQQVPDPTAPTACNNFYEYVCSGKTKKPPVKLQDFRYMTLPDDVDQYQEYVFTPETKKSLWDIVDPDVVSKWFVQFQTYVEGIKWIEHQKRHEELLSLQVEQKQETILQALGGFKFSVLARFYKSLKKSIEYLTQMKIPISTRNHFYHGLFDDLRDIHISEIKTYSRYSEEHKQTLVDKVRNLKIIFPYLEYNDVSIWRRATSEYEREYYRLKTLVNETVIPADMVEKIIRIAAVDPAMKVFESYMNEFTPRFIFQHVVAAATSDSFNYLNEIHCSVFTMIDPNVDPKSVYRQFLYVLSHELQHVHFNIDPPPFEEHVWNSENECIVRNLDYFADQEKKNQSDWSLASFSYEDSATVAGLRLAVLYNVQRTSDNQEIRDSLEQSVARFCTKNRTHIHHNPADVSINLALSQLPTFNSLYNCTKGDRMYVEPEDLCRVLNMDIDGNDYTTQKIENDDLFLLTQFMDVLENTADELDAANITTFEGKLFDITVEDVEKNEEALEGSAESSSESSESEEEVEGSEEKELDEVGKELDGDSSEEKEIQHAEIGASSRNLLSPISFFISMVPVMMFLRF